MELSLPPAIAGKKQQHHHHAHHQTAAVGRLMWTDLENSIQIGATPVHLHHGRNNASPVKTSLPSPAATPGKAPPRRRAGWRDLFRPVGAASARPPTPGAHSTTTLSTTPARPSAVSPTSWRPKATGGEGDRRRRPAGSSSLASLFCSLSSTVALWNDRENAQMRAPARLNLLKVRCWSDPTGNELD
jgi:hypothetical protein